MQLMRIHLSCFLLLLSIGLHAQETIQEKENYSFSLEEAINFALDSSYTAINAKRDIAAAAKQSSGRIDVCSKDQ